jgi:hypothetical protein
MLSYVQRNTVAKTETPNTKVGVMRQCNSTATMWDDVGLDYSLMVDAIHLDEAYLL